MRILTPAARPAVHNPSTNTLNCPAVLPSLPPILGMSVYHSEPGTKLPTAPPSVFSQLILSIAQALANL